MWREFARELFSDVKALVSGTASFLIAAVSAYLPNALPPTIFFPVGYICLAYAAYRLWARERLGRQADVTKLHAEIDRLRETLATKPHFPDRLRANIQKTLLTLNEAERDLLRELLTPGGMLQAELENHIQSKGYAMPGNSYSDFGNYLSHKCGFLERTPTNRWQVKPPYWETVNELLGESPPLTAPQP
jgi:hypothetical protein